MAAKRISEDDVVKVARLARLELTEAEVNRFTSQLGAVLEHVGRLEELDTRDVPPAIHGLAARAPLRADEVTPGLAHDKALANAPAQRDGGFAVPRILSTGKAAT